MRKFTALLLGFSYLTVCLGQTKEKTSYRYDKMQIDYQKDYSNAKFILEYIFIDEMLLGGDKYRHSITVTDTIVTLKSIAPDFKTNNDVDYKKEFKLSPKELDTLKLVTKKANLKQLKSGIARCQNDKCTREILIVKCDEIQIAGGQTYRSLESYANSISDDEAEELIEKDKRNSSSIGGDYDSIINILKKYFKNVEEPDKEVLKP